MVLGTKTAELAAFPWGGRKAIFLFLCSPRWRCGAGMDPITERWGRRTQSLPCSGPRAQGARSGSRGREPGSAGCPPCRNAGPGPRRMQRPRGNSAGAWAGGLRAPLRAVHRGRPLCGKAGDGNSERSGFVLAFCCFFFLLFLSSRAVFSGAL